MLLANGFITFAIKGNPAKTIVHLKCYFESFYANIISE